MKSPLPLWERVRVRGLYRRSVAYVSGFQRVDDGYAGRHQGLGVSRRDAGFDLRSQG
jgi:hypothetical protein